MTDNLCIHVPLNLKRRGGRKMILLPEEAAIRHGLTQTEKPGTAGRPSTTKHVLEEHARRIEAGTTYKNRTQDKDIVLPSRDSIRNALMKVNQ